MPEQPPVAVPPRLEPVLEEVGPLAARFRDAGHRLYLVGGVVRDALLDRLRPDAEYDLTTDARPAEVKALVAGAADAVWTQGEAFGTIGFRRGGRDYEITTHRAEAYRSSSRKPVVTFADRVEDDLARRDFTVNALALEVPEPRLVDPFDGVGDLAAGRLRTPLDADISFGDDPLRMLRAARFVAGYGMQPDPALVSAVERLRERMEIVAPERARDELDKLLVVDDPAPGLWFLLDTGLAGELIPELPALRLEQDPIHRHKDVLAHTVAVVQKCSADRILRLAALFHDVGKPKTRSIGPNGVSFHHHEVVGARMTRERLHALRYPTVDIEAVSTLVFLHLRFHGYRGDVWTDSAVRRYVRDAGDQLERLNELVRCDCTTRNRRKAEALQRRMDDLERRIEELREREELARIRPDLDGHQVMEHLGIPPGPAVGEALDHLLELRLEHGPLGEEEAYRQLDTWWEANRHRFRPAAGRAGQG